MAGDPRRTQQHQRNAAALRKLGLPCAICGGPIDYDAPRYDPNAFAADHIVPVSVNPDAALDPANLRPAHRWCNGSRGNRDTSSNVEPRRSTREW